MSDIHVCKHIIQMYTVNKVPMCVISALKVANSFFLVFYACHNDDSALLQLSLESALKDLIGVVIQGGPRIHW